MWSGAVPWWGGGEKGARGHRPPPRLWLFFYIDLFFYFFFLACQLRAQSCTLMIIPLTHYDDYGTHFFRSGKYVSQSPSLTPSPFCFACPHSQRARVSELQSISSKLLIWISRTAGETPLGVGLVLSLGWCGKDNRRDVKKEKKGIKMSNLAKCNWTLTLLFWPFTQNDI